MDYSLPGSSVLGILQARILEWAAIPSSRGSSWLRDRTWVSYTAGRFITIWATREAQIDSTLFDYRRGSPYFVACSLKKYILPTYQKLLLWKDAWVRSEVTQSSLTLCDPMDCSLPGSSVHGIFQARVLEWVAIPFSKKKMHRHVYQFLYGPQYLHKRFRILNKDSYD